jgi:hypothetical protein
MGREFKRILMAIATGVIIYVIIGPLIWHSLPHGPTDGDSLQTPVITMLVHQNGSLNCTFTVVSITYYEILWSDILVEVHYNTASIKAPDSSGFINFWDEVVITFSSEVETAVLLKYLPTGGVSYSLVFTPLA